MLNKGGLVVVGDAKQDMHVDSENQKGSEKNLRTMNRL
jgi:hypothetical protein